MTTGNPIADSFTQQIPTGEQAPETKVRFEGMDFETLMKERYSREEQFALTQGARIAALEHLIRHMDPRKPMTHEKLVQLTDAIDKQNIDRIKLDMGGGSDAFSGLADAIGKFLMQQPTNDKAPGYDPQASGTIADKNLDDMAEKSEPVPGQTYIGVEKLNSDDFI